LEKNKKETAVGVIISSWHAMKKRFTFFTQNTIEGGQ
jgi:hypothetical protein